jgi:hypothetical protein
MIRTQNNSSIAYIPVHTCPNMLVRSVGIHILVAWPAIGTAATREDIEDFSVPFSSRSI